MKTCAVIGKGSCPKPVFGVVIESLIVKQAVHIFYVPEKGNFHQEAAAVILRLQKIYPQISCCILSSCTGKEPIFPADIAVLYGRKIIMNTSVRFGKRCLDLGSIANEKQPPF